MDPLTANRVIQVVEYDPEWPKQFEQLQESIWPFVRDIALAIEHVGSTAVPRLAAKPIIDTDVVVPSRNEVRAAIVRLEALGYRHRGNRGVEDREAFFPPSGVAIAHHLYVCPSGSISLRNHLTLRNHLRAHPEDILAYSALKRSLAEQFSEDIGSYVEGKSEFILSVLTQYGFETEQLHSIREANRNR